MSISPYSGQPVVPRRSAPTIQIAESEALTIEFIFALTSNFPCGPNGVFVMSAGAVYVCPLYPPPGFLAESVKMPSASQLFRISFDVYQTSVDGDQSEWMPSSGVRSHIV